MKALLILSCLSASLISCTTLTKFIGPNSAHPESQSSETSFVSSPRGDGADVIDSMYSTNEQLTAAAEQEEYENAQSMSDPASVPAHDHIAPLGDPSFAQSEVSEASHIEDFMVAPIDTPEVANIDLMKEQQRVMAPKRVVKKSYKKPMRVVEKSKPLKKVIVKNKIKSKKSKAVAKKNSKQSKKYAKDSKKSKMSKVAKNKQKSKKVASKSTKKRNVAVSNEGYKVSRK